MNKDSDSNIIKDILRWLLFFPIAALAFFIPFFFYQLFLDFMIQRDYYTIPNFYPPSYSPTYPISQLFIFYFVVFSSFFLFVHTGSSVAPSNKKTIAIILSLFLIASLILFFYITNFATEAFNLLFLELVIYINYAIIFGIIGVITANLTIKKGILSTLLTFFFIFLILIFGSFHFFNTRENTKNTFISNEDFIDIENRVQTCELAKSTESYLQGDRSNPTRCYAKVAMDLNNYYICEELGNKDRLFVPGWVPYCYAEIAVIRRNKRVCDLIDDIKFPGYQKQCRGFVEIGEVGNFLHTD